MLSPQPSSKRSSLKSKKPPSKPKAKLDMNDAQIDLLTLKIGARLLNDGEFVDDLIDV